MGKQDDLRDYLQGLMGNEIVKDFMFSGIKKKFYGLSNEDILTVINEFIDEGRLEKEFEVNCCYCNNMITTIKEGEDLKDYYCIYCDKDLDKEDLTMLESYKKV